MHVVEERAWWVGRRLPNLFPKNGCGGPVFILDQGEVGMEAGELNLTLEADWEDATFYGENSWRRGSYAKATGKGVVQSSLDPLKVLAGVKVYQVRRRVNLNHGFEEREDDLGLLLRFRLLIHCSDIPHDFIGCHFNFLNDMGAVRVHGHPRVKDNPEVFELCNLN